MVRSGGVSHIIYRAWDRERAFQFFTEAFGFYEQRRGNFIYAGLGDTLIEISQSDDPPDEVSARYVFGLQVDDIDEAVRVAEEHGATIVRPIFSPASFWGRQAVVSVPGGPALALREWEAPDGPHFAGWSKRE
jgi:predicted enzyme related to lactoylglutathione lyase